VVGVLFRLGDDHADLLKIGEQAPRKKGQTKPLDLDLARMTITREHDSYLRYTGSLTTPPCSEGVRWYVLKEVSHISKKQVKNFIELIGEDARGPEPQNARIVLEH
jgi:carbonic anhydrase